MPIYEYRCPDCGHQFEVMQKFSDDPIKVCPSCQAEDVRKLISAPAFHLKGGGWYKDHYGLKGSSSSGSASGASSDGASGSDGSASGSDGSASSSSGSASSSSGSASGSSSDSASSS